MNLDFGILWIEDSFSTEEEENLKRRIREAGFIARIDAIPNSQGIENHARDHKLYHRFDLILLDYKLKDENGDEIAGRIRSLFPTTTILFYSGSEDETKLRRMIADKQVEGVYCSARRRFIDRAGGLIEQTARSLDRLSGMRGLAMRVVAECDDLMKKSVLSMSERDVDCEAKTAELDSDVFAFIEQMRSRYEESCRGTLNTRFETRAIDSAKLFSHFRRLTQQAATNGARFGLRAETADRFRELRRQTAQYPRDVLTKRNILGHVIERHTPSGWVLDGSTEISVADFPEIRRVFATQIDALRELSGMVMTPVDYGDS